MSSARNPRAVLRAFRNGVTDESLRVAILLGLATVPITLLFSLDAVGSDSAVSGNALFVAGLLAGYYYSDRETTRRRAGIWTGLAGSVASVLLIVADTIALLESASSTLDAVFLALTPVALALAVGAAVLVTVIGAWIGDWVGTRLGGGRTRLGTEPDPTSGGRGRVLESRWWQIVLAYVLLVPTVFYGLWVNPESGAGFFAVWLGIASLTVLSVVALASLFVDVTALRGAGADWLPNVWLYVGVPIAACALVYAVRLGESINPAGDAIYGFMVALWLAAVVYLAARYRHLGTLRPGTAQPS